MRSKINFMLLTVVLAGITFGSLRNPPSGMQQTASMFSLIAHFTSYFILAAALLLYFHDTLPGHVEAVLLAGTVGIGMELLQLQLPWRTFSLTDMAVNIAGSSLVFPNHNLELVTRIIEKEDRLIENFLDS